MGAIYRGLAVVAAVAVAAVGVALVLPSGPDEAGPRPVAAPSAVPVSSGPPAVEPASGIVGDETAPTPTPTPTPSATTPRPTPTPGTSLAPGYTAMEALYADERLPRLPAKLKRLSLPRAGRSVVKDKRTGLAVPKLS